MTNETYVVVALALCCLIALFYTLDKQPSVLSIMDLKEFKHLPGELKYVLKQSLPNSEQIRRRWNSMNARQKQIVMQQIMSQLPGMPAPSPPSPPPPPTPASPTPTPPTPEPTESPLEKGFLLKQNKKKNTKNKEKQEVVTLSIIGTTEHSNGASLNDGNSVFLGSDD